MDSRNCCQESRQASQVRCLWCGSALGQGRPPTDGERYETSREARLARQRQAELARRSCAEIDAIVIGAVVGSIPANTIFTYADLAATGLSSVALKHALLRLASAGHVERAGRIHLKAERYRPLWRWNPVVRQATAQGDDEKRAVRRVASPTAEQPSGPRR